MYLKFVCLRLFNFCKKIYFVNFNQISENGSNNAQNTAPSITASQILMMFTYIFQTESCTNIVGVVRNVGNSKLYTSPLTLNPTKLKIDLPRTMNQYLELSSFNYLHCNIFSGTHNVKSIKYNGLNLCMKHFIDFWCHLVILCTHYLSGPISDIN